MPRLVLLALLAIAARVREERGAVIGFAAAWRGCAALGGLGLLRGLCLSREETGGFGLRWGWMNVKLRESGLELAVAQVSKG